MFLSIIIPYYECGAYIYTCVKSVVEAINDYDDIEIIIVDDFNNDEQVRLLESSVKALSDGKCKIIRPTKNLGLSDARNFGIELSKGDYIYFLDADDYVNSQNLNQIINILRNIQTDIIYFDSHTFKDENNWQGMWKFSFHPRSIVNVNDEVIANYLRDTNFYVWRYISKRTLFETTKFHSGMYMEDAAISPVILSKASRIWYEPISVVNYRIRPNSIMTSWKPRKYTDMVLGSSIAANALSFNSQNSKKLKKEISIMGYRFFYWAIGDARKADKTAVNYDFYESIKNLYIDKFGTFDILKDVNKLYELYGLEETIKWLLLYYDYGLFNLIITPHGHFKYKAYRRKIWNNLIIISKVILPILITLSLLSNIYYVISVYRTKKRLKY